MKIQLRAPLILRASMVFCITLVLGLTLVACSGNSPSSSSGGAQSQDQPKYHWDSFIDLANIDKQVCRYEERSAGRVGIYAETDDEKMPVPENYRLIGHAKADDSIVIYEVTDANNQKVYRAYGERTLFREDGGGTSHAVAKRRGFVDILFLAEEVDGAEGIQGGHDNHDSLKDVYSVVSAIASDKGTFHYAAKNSFSDCPDDRKLMEAQGIDYDTLPAE